jgi:PPK2 family polyphosphate:nucleotide phosphotransferase
MSRAPRNAHGLAVIDSPYLVPFDGGFELASASTVPPMGSGSDKALKHALKEESRAISELLEPMYANPAWSVLCIFQAMDAAGKDSTIRAVFRHLDPNAVKVFAFKKPSREELDHDFLWRCYRRLPRRGQIGVFNRSHYEDALIVRVHPQLLGHSKLPQRPPLGDLWKQRFDSIREFERHLYRNGTLVLKFFLNVSFDEQGRRFLRRYERADKRYKFSPHDVAQRDHWGQYMEAYQDALRETSRAYAPWYAIPADSKPYMRTTVAGIVRQAMENLAPQFPALDAETTKQQREAARRLEEELEE